MLLTSEMTDFHTTIYPLFILKREQSRGQQLVYYIKQLTSSFGKFMGVLELICNWSLEHGL